MPTRLDNNNQPRQVPSFYVDANNVLHYLTAEDDTVLDGDITNPTSHANTADFAGGLLANAVAQGNVAVSGILSVNNYLKVSGNTGLTGNVALTHGANTVTLAIVGGIIVGVTGS